MTSTLLSEVGRGEGMRGTTIPCVPPTSKDPYVPPESKEVGARIVRAREEKTPKPWSQFDLALALSVSPSTIYRWEKGKLPSMSELIRLAEVLDKPFSYFAEPPERQTELSDLRQGLEEIRSRLEELRAEGERARGAALASLASIDVRLSRIEARLGLQDGQDSEAQ